MTAQVDEKVATAAGAARSQRRRVVAVAGSAVGLAVLVFGVLQRGATPVLQTVVDGSRLGLALALIGVGLSLIYATTGIFNFAQGEFATLGAAVTLWLNTALGLPVIAAAVIAVAVAGLAGLSSERVLWRPLRARRVDTISALVVAIGLGLALRSLFLALMGGSTHSYREYSIQNPIDIAGVSITPKALWSCIVCLAAFALLGYFLKKTRAGQAIRAVADDKTLAAASGIAVNAQLSLVWAIGGALAALGGVLLGFVEQVRWDMGNQVLLLVIAGVTLGGLGTVAGAVVGSVVVGIATQVSTLWLPAELKYVTALLLLVLILLVRPQGILGRRERLG
ncbi:branched-chain amino acid ABC transporter permease [Mycolicibacterium agri]|uniref:Branched-chain amino acid ABC transporter permease n=1 Tax=Mycolicibacterium agri TaxID=36811 RepID=A0A2A7MQM7_MYCAG|nr:branched-chain amino acid ABC transporter permease [Mycolicibacterium agri]GFG52842.1 branched-chain amino acid ABC transporter permease [Mycolicibacterium agri]